MCFLSAVQGSRVVVREADGLPLVSRHQRPVLRLVRPGGEVGLAMTVSVTFPRSCQSDHAACIRSAQVFPERQVSAPRAAQPLALELRADQSVCDRAESATSQSEQRRADAGNVLVLFT